MNSLNRVSRSRSIQIFFLQAGVLTRANLKARYRKTFAGFLWVVISPLITYSVQCYVFKTVLKIQLIDYPLFLLSGLLPWIFITQSLEMGTSIFMQSARILKSYPVNPLVYLLAQLLDNCVNFFASFFLILAFTVATKNFDWLRLSLLPLALLPLFIATFGLTWLLATLQVFYRDTRFILTLVLNIAFFLTPIFYPISYVPEEYRWVVLFNPINALIAPVRSVVYQNAEAQFATSIMVAIAIAIATLLLAFLFWKKKRNLVYHYL